MRLSKSLKSFKFLLTICLMVSCTAAFANTGTKEHKKAADKEQIENTAVQQESKQEKTSAQVNGQEEPSAEEEGTKMSKSSFNYFFYLIYKAKFEDIFRFPVRNTNDPGISLHRVNINALIERLTTPEF